MILRPIDISMKTMVEQYTKAWKLRSSEYTFTNLLIWGDGGNLKIAEENDTLFLFWDYGVGKPFMFAPLTRDPGADYKLALDKAAEHCRSMGIEPVFKGISCNIAKAFEKCEGYEMKPDRDNYDYIYSMESLRDLAGKKLHGKRNHINRFMSEYGNTFEYVNIDKSMLDECLELYDEWLEGTDDPSAAYEKNAIRTIISNMDELNVKGAGIRIGGRLAAYTFGERIDGSMAVVHIEKADKDIQGLYTVINNLFIKNELSDMELINREEDMGLEGLRKAKLSYNPVGFIEKFEGVPCR